MTMDSYYEKFISKNELTLTFKEKGIPEEYLEYCISKFARILEDTGIDEYSQEEKDEEIREDIDWSVTKTSQFIKEIEKGYSREFAELIIYNFFDGPKAIADSYNQLKKENPEQAKKNLDVYFKNSDFDEICIDYCNELLEKGKGYFDVTRFARAKTYSQIYNDAISIGKSVEYAKIFASQRVDIEVNSIFYCECFATYFIEAKSNGKNGVYAEFYAHNLSQYFEKRYPKFEEIKYDDIDLHMIQMVKDELDKINW